MGVIKFFLVILLCIPMACLLLFFLNNLITSIRKQQDKAERIRRNKAIFQENSEPEINRNIVKKNNPIIGNADMIEKIKKIGGMVKIDGIGKKIKKLKFNTKNKRSGRRKKV